MCFTTEVLHHSAGSAFAQAPALLALVAYELAAGSRALLSRAEADVEIVAEDGVAGSK